MTRNARKKSPIIPSPRPRPGRPGAEQADEDFDQALIHRARFHGGKLCPDETVPRMRGPQPVSVASRVISALSSLETGQPALALAASFSNVA
jgi:hypothetical protein